MCYCRFRPLHPKQDQGIFPEVYTTGGKTADLRPSPGESKWGIIWTRLRAQSVGCFSNEKTCIIFPMRDLLSKYLNRNPNAFHYLKFHEFAPEFYTLSIVRNKQKYFEMNVVKRFSFRWSLRYLKLSRGKGFVVTASHKFVITDRSCANM